MNLPLRLSRIAMRLTVSSLLCATPAFTAQAGDGAAPSPAQASEEYAQLVRAEARRLAVANAGPDDLRQAVERLEALLTYLATPLSRDLAVGLLPLHMRPLDIQLDLAAIHARLGNKDQALTALEATQRYAWLDLAAAPLLGRADFDAIRTEPRFQAILATARVPAMAMKDTGADAPYSERLSVEQRIAGLSQFWSEAREYFVHFDAVPDLDWNQAYRDFLPKVMAAETTAEYYRILMQFAPLLRDGHTNIYAPEELGDRFYARPPIETALVGDTVMVTAVRSPALARRLAIGDEIVAIDGLPVGQHVLEKVAPFVSSSTAQDRSLRMYSYQLLTGDASVLIRLALRDSRGRTREEIVARAGYTDTETHAPFAFRMLRGDIAYFSLDHFESDAGVAAFERALPQIMQAKGLVIDVRRNGGGSTAYGERILAHLTDKPIPHTMSLIRDNRSAGDGPPVMRWTAPHAFRATPRPQADIFKGRVVVLTSERTFSAGEDFVLAFNALERGKTIGATTGGSTGQPKFFALPGGGTARICAKRDLLPDGSRLVGKGIAPDIDSAPTVRSIRDGSDPALERALAQLNPRS